MEQEINYILMGEKILEKLRDMVAKYNKLVLENNYEKKL